MTWIDQLFLLDKKSRMLEPHLLLVVAALARGGPGAWSKFLTMGRLGPAQQQLSPSSRRTSFKCLTLSVLSPHFSIRSCDFGTQAELEY